MRLKLPVFPILFLINAMVLSILLGNYFYLHYISELNVYLMVTIGILILDIICIYCSMAKVLKKICNKLSQSPLSVETDFIYRAHTNSDYLLEKIDNYAKVITNQKKIQKILDYEITKLKACQVKIEELTSD